MWFKNIRLYRLAEEFNVGTEQLEQALEAQAFAPCGKTERSRGGFVRPVRSDNAALAHTLGDYVMLCFRRDERMLPSSVVNDELEEKVRDIEEKQDRKVYRKEKQQLKDEVILELLPRAFVRSRRIYAYLALKEGLLVVDSSSATLAEELINTLREGLGSFPASLPEVPVAPMSVMTRWVREGQASNHFQIDQDCELVNPLEDGNVIRCKAQDLTSEEITVHLDAGKQVRKLGVIWNDAVRCVLNADLTLSRLRFEDMVLERAAEADAETAAEQFDQDFAVMTLVLSDLFRSLFAVFQDEPEAAA